MPTKLSTESLTAALEELGRARNDTELAARIQQRIKRRRDRHTHPSLPVLIQAAGFVLHLDETATAILLQTRVQTVRQYTALSADWAAVDNDMKIRALQQVALELINLKLARVFHRASPGFSVYLGDLTPRARRYRRIPTHAALLTGQELEYLRLFLLGYTDPQIAAELGIMKADWHREQLLRKFRAKGKQALLIKCRRLKLNAADLVEKHLTYL